MGRSDHSAWTVLVLGIDHPPGPCVQNQVPWGSQLSRRVWVIQLRGRARREPPVRSGAPGRGPVWYPGCGRPAAEEAGAAWVPRASQRSPLPVRAWRSSSRLAVGRTPVPGSMDHACSRPGRVRRCELLTDDRGEVVRATEALCGRRCPVVTVAANPSGHVVPRHVKRAMAVHHMLYGGVRVRPENGDAVAGLEGDSAALPHNGIVEERAVGRHVGELWLQHQR